MCIQHISIGRYADGREIIQKREWEVCRHDSPHRPRDCEHFYDEKNEYHIYDVRTSMSSRSSDTSPFRGAPSVRAPSSIESRDREPRRYLHHSKKKEKEFTPLVFNALFGGKSEKTTRRSSSHSQTTVIIEGGAPRVYPISPPSLFRPSFDSSYRYPPSSMSPTFPGTPGFESTWEANIVNTSSVNRERRGTPVVVDNGRRERRSESTEVHADISTAASNARTPSTNYRDARQREARFASEEKRRRQRRERDDRIAEFERDVQQDQLRQQRRRERDLQNAEINGRPVAEQNSLPARPGILRHPSRRRSRRDSIIEDLRMTERGEQVLREAIAEKEAEERRDAEREAANAKLRRLRRRFERVVLADEDFYRSGRRG